MLQSIASPLPADTSSPGLDFIPFLNCAVQTVQTNKIRAEEQIGRVPFLTGAGAPGLYPRHHTVNNGL